MDKLVNANIICFIIEKCHTQTKIQIRVLSYTVKWSFKSETKMKKKFKTKLIHKFRVAT